MTDTNNTGKHAGGRPTKYDPAYCDVVVEFCAGGYSLTAFAGKIGVSRQTISEWCDVHPEFSVSVQAAKAAAALSLEEDAKRIRTEGGGTGSATLTIFGLKNFAGDDFREIQEHKHRGAIGTYDATKLSELTDDELNRLDELRARLVLAGSRPSDPGRDSEEGG